MKTVMIHQNQRGLLFKNGRFVKMLEAGKYRLFGSREVEIFSAGEPLSPMRCTLETLMADKTVMASLSTVEVADRQIALHFVDGRYDRVLSVGRHAFLTDGKEHSFRLLDVSDPQSASEVDPYILSRIASCFYSKVEVAEYQKALLFLDGRFVRVLDAGTYYFWKNEVRVETRFVDTRLTRMDITGQEILTQDKVTLRVNFVCNYRVTDVVRIHTEIDDYIEQIHIAAQMALRTYIGRAKLDDILENKEELSRFVFEQLKEKESALFVEFSDVGVKDIILPGEIREIMNTVLIAEKRAQANVITRREEVASTRSLLNTARLMDENQTLYKLKELEYVERICENVGHITLGGTGDLLTQLTGLLRGRMAE